MSASLTLTGLLSLLPDFPHRYDSLLECYLQGEDVNLCDNDFEGVTVSVSCFTREVLRAVAQIRRGETVTYKELAQRIGRPSAVRAVASALGRNPLPIIIPCHRVVASQGKLGGYAFGLELKSKLLDFERQRAILVRPQM